MTIAAVVSECQLLHDQSCEYRRLWNNYWLLWAL